jgi:VanZ family protein
MELEEFFKQGDKIMHMLLNAGIFVIVFSFLMSAGVDVYLSAGLGIISCLIVSVLKEMKDLFVDKQSLSDSINDFVADLIGMIAGAVFIVAEYYLILFLG